MKAMNSFAATSAREDYKKFKIRLSLYFYFHLTYQIKGALIKKNRIVGNFPQHGGVSLIPKLLLF